MTASNFLPRCATFFDQIPIDFEGKQRETCKCVLNNGYEQQGMKLPKYNLGYNTRDQLRSLAISASERKHPIESLKICNSNTMHLGKKFVASIFSVVVCYIGLIKLHRSSFNLEFETLFESI